MHNAVFKALIWISITMHDSSLLLASCGAPILRDIIHFYVNGLGERVHLVFTMVTRFVCFVILQLNLSFFFLPHFNGLQHQTVVMALI